LLGIFSKPFAFLVKGFCFEREPSKTTNFPLVFVWRFYMARVTGIPTLSFAANALCNAVSKFTPLIQRLFPENELLLAALDAANLACVALRLELAKVREYGD
jgi:hypothetical protein